MSASGWRVTQGQPDTCLFLAFDEVTNAWLKSDSQERQERKQEKKKKKGVGGGGGWTGTRMAAERLRRVP